MTLSQRLHLIFTILTIVILAPVTVVINTKLINYLSKHHRESYLKLNHLLHGSNQIKDSFSVSGLPTLTEILIFLVLLILFYFLESLV